MTDKLTLTNLVNLQNEDSAVTSINNNNAAIITAINNTLSRDGTSPNQMAADLDMNSNRILNLPIPVADSEPLRLADVAQVTQFQNSVDLSAALATANTSATNASSSATAAATSATNAASSATAASTSATNAATSATNAANSATQAASVVTNFTSIFNYIPSSEHAAITAGTSTYNAGPDIVTALNALNGQPLYFPPGTYRVTTAVKYHPAPSSVFTSGAKIYGAGSGQTIFQNGVAGTQLTGAFSTTNLSTIVTVNWTAHGKAVGDCVTFMNVGSHSYGGLDMEGNWYITSVTANTFTFNHYASATSTISATGTVTVTQPLFDIDTSGGFKIQLGVTLQGFQITNTGFGGLVGSSAIRLRHCYQALIDDVWINGATCDGIQLPCVQGDQDGCTQVKLGRVRIDSCGRWGIDMAAGQTTVAGVLTGYNEISNTVLESVFINACGTSQSAYQYGGGIKWKGQGLQMTSISITACSNCAIYIPGGAGLASGVTFNFVVCENNTGRQFVIEGLDTLTGQLLELYSNDSFVSTTGLYLNAANYSINNINILSSIVRATSGNNAYTAFVAAGADLGTAIRIYTPSFQNFGYAGQAQASGVTFKT